MTRLLTAMTLATIFANVAMATPADDIGDEPAPTCERADFKNHGQWVKCLTHSGVKGRDLADTIHAEKRGRKATPKPEKDAPTKRKDKVAKDGKTKGRKDLKDPKKGR